VSVFLEPVGRRRAVHLFGGGHVGGAAAEVLAGMPFETHLLDPRPDWSSPRDLPRGVRPHHADPLAYAAGRAWSGDDAACVLTHSHELDFALILRLLREPVGYLGLIGSEHKARVFAARLEGLPDGERLRELWEEKVRCPIGIPLPSKNPKVIAVSIAAQLLREWGLRQAACVPETAEPSAA
jgi:xanthine dehydrogenase accessory factor